MMTHPSESELPSAWHDGETTAAENAEVARLRASQDAAKTAAVERELADYRRISAWIAEVGGTADPVDREFTADVMGRLKPRARLRPAAAAEPSNKRGRSWTAAVASLATAAAIIAVAVVVLRAPRDDRELAVHNPDRAPAAASVDPESESRGLAFKESNIRARRSDDEIARLPGGKSTSDESLNKVELSETVPRLAGVVNSLTDREADELESALRKLTSADAKDAAMKAGGVYRARTEAEEDALVVEFTVVDVRRSVDAMQVLLSRSEVPSIQKTTEETDERDELAAARDSDAAKSDGTADKADADGELVAIYFETSPETLTAALEQIRADRRFQTPRVREPLPLDGVRLAARENVNAFAQRRSNPLPADAKPRAARSLPKPEISESRTGRTLKELLVEASRDDVTLDRSRGRGGFAGGEENRAVKRAKPNAAGESTPSRNTSSNAKPRAVAGGRGEGKPLAEPSAPAPVVEQLDRPLASRSFQMTLRLERESLEVRVETATPAAAPRRPAAIVADAVNEPGETFEKSSVAAEPVAKKKAASRQPAREIRDSSSSDGYVRVLFVFRESSSASQ